MSPRKAVKCSLLLVLGLPLLLVVFYWVGGLLDAMGDAAAVGVLRHLSTLVSVLWLVSIVGLVVSLGIDALGPQDRGQ